MGAVQTDEAGEGLRARKKRERRQALHQAAVELSLAHGYAQVTVEDICRRCDVAPRTFFNYFASKEEAVVGRADMLSDDDVQSAVTEFEHGSPSGVLLTDFRVLLTILVQTRAKAREDLKRHVELLRSDPSLLQAQLSRMDSNVQLLRKVVERRLARDSGMDVEIRAGVNDETLDPALDSVFGRRAQVLAGLGVTVLRLTAERIYAGGVDAAGTVTAVFDEFSHLFTQENR